MEAEDWIQESLARLEALEEERNTVEAGLEEAEDAAEVRRLSERLQALDREIKGLYAALEAAAEGDDGAAPPAEESESDQATALFRREDLARMAESTSDPAAAASFFQAREAAARQAAQPAPQAAAEAAPPAGFGAPPAGFGAPPAGFGAPQAPAFGAAPAQGFGPPMAASSDFGGGSDYADVDEPAGGKSKMPLIAAVIVLIVVGVGGYMLLGNKTDETPTDDAPQGPAKVIKAGELPPDTQGPRAAKGADVDSVEGSRFKEGRPSGGGGGSRPSGGSSGSTTKEKKKDNSKTKIINTDDPLAGIDTK